MQRTNEAANERILDTTAVAKQLQVDPQTVRKLVRNGTLPASGRVGIAYLFDPKDVESVRKSLYRDGYTHTDIARMYGKSRNTVIYWFRAYGIEPDGHDRRQPRAPAVYNLEKVRYIARELDWEIVEEENE